MFQQARIKALHEQVIVSEVIRDLLARWVAGDIELSPGNRARDRQVALARAAHGMWADRDPDAFLAASREGLLEHDEELAYARLDARYGRSQQLLPPPAGRAPLPGRDPGRVSHRRVFDHHRARVVAGIRPGEAERNESLLALLERVPVDEASARQAGQLRQ